MFRAWSGIGTTLKDPATLGTNIPVTVGLHDENFITEAHDTYGGVDTITSVLEPSASREEVVCHRCDDLAFGSRSDVEQAVRGN